MSAGAVFHVEHLGFRVSVTSPYECLRDLAQLQILSALFHVERCLSR